MGGQGFEFIGGGHKRQARDARHIGGDFGVPPLIGVQPRANGSAALCQLINARKRHFDACDAIADLLGIAREFLPQG